MAEAEPKARDRAFAVAAVRALGSRAETVCGRRGAALKRYALELAGDPARLAREAARLDGTPAGLRAIHSSWLELPPPSSRPEAAAWLRRVATGHLVAMEPPEPSLPLDWLERLDADALVRLITALGKRRVAIAFSGAPRAALARLCARLGEPQAGELIEQVRALGPRLTSDETRAAQRAVFHLSGQLGEAPTGGAGEADRTLFLRAGASWLGPALAERGGDRVQRVAQRLPRAAGELLLFGASSPATEAENAQAVAAALLLA